jgi:hypothetical protein
MSSTLFCNVGDKNRMNLIEEWQTRKDVELHFRSEIFGVLLGTNSLLRKPLEIQIFTVSDCEGIEAVHSARKKKN